MKKRFILLAFIIILLLYSVSCTKLPRLIGNENAAEAITYKGVKYISTGFFCAANDKHYLGKADNGANVYAVGNKKDPVYIVIDGEDNTGCYIREGCSVPTAGTITKVLVDPYIRGNNKHVLSKQEDLNIISELTGCIGEMQEFTVENFFKQGNQFYYVYDGSNVSTNQNYGGYIAYVNGTWIYSAPEMKIDIDLSVNNTAVVEAIIIEDAELINRICKTSLVKYIEY